MVTRTLLVLSIIINLANFRELSKLRDYIVKNPSGNGIHYVGEDHAFICEDGMTFSSDNLPHLNVSDTAEQSTAIKINPTKIKGFYINQYSAFGVPNPTSQTIIRVQIFDSSGNKKYDNVVDCAGSDWDDNRKKYKTGNWVYIKTGKIKKAQKVVVPNTNGPNPLTRGFRPSLRWLNPSGYDPLGDQE